MQDLAASSFSEVRNRLLQFWMYFHRKTEGKVHTSQVCCSPKVPVSGKGIPWNISPPVIKKAYLSHIVENTASPLVSCTFWDVIPSVCGPDRWEKCNYPNSLCSNKMSCQTTEREMMKQKFRIHRSHSWPEVSHQGHKCHDSTGPSICYQYSHLFPSFPKHGECAHHELNRSSFIPAVNSTLSRWPTIWHVHRN